MRCSIKIVLAGLMLFNSFVSAESDDYRDLVNREWHQYTQPIMGLAEEMMVELRQEELQDPRIRQEFYEFIFSELSAAYGALVYADPEYPDLWPMWSHLYQHLNPNPDTYYLSTPLQDDGIYRLSGNRGSVLMVDFMIGGGGFVSRGESGTEMGPTFANYKIDDMALADNGDYEFILSSERPEGYQGNWRELTPGTTYMLIRQVAYDWANEENATVAIERLDRPAIKPRYSAEHIENNLRHIATWAKNWMKIGFKWVKAPREKNGVNTFGFIGFDDVTKFRGQAYYEAAYTLNDDEALIVEVKVPDQCVYWNIQMIDGWWRNTGGIHHQSSLNGLQAKVDPDGIFRAVVSAQDPGVPNWLDSRGFDQGIVYGRWNQCSSTPLPAAKRVKLADVREYLPRETPTVSVEERDSAIRQRRESAQLRRRW
jgi:hypothetical protein